MKIEVFQEIIYLYVKSENCYGFSNCPWNKLTGLPKTRGFAKDLY